MHNAQPFADANVPPGSYEPVVVAKRYIIKFVRVLLSNACGDDVVNVQPAPVVYLTVVVVSVIAPTAISFATVVVIGADGVVL